MDVNPWAAHTCICVCEILVNELRSVILCVALVPGLLWHQPPDPFWLLDNLSPKQLPQPPGKPRLTPFVLLHTHDNKHRRSKETIIAVCILRASRTPPTGFFKTISRIYSFSQSTSNASATCSGTTFFKGLFPPSVSFVSVN